MRSALTIVLMSLFALLAAACGGGAVTPRTGPAPQETPGATASAKEVPPMHAPEPSPAPAPSPAPRTELATFGGGCFWCIEAVLEQIDGVTDVRSGYMGGTTRRPTYRDVCSGETGHAEVVQVAFDPSKVSYDTLLAWFWKSHDPTSLNRQGADEGTQYRSVIFWHTPEQKAAAERSKAELGKLLEDPVVTEISQASEFTEAEEYHQDYYRQNRAQPYCRMVIQPKLKKLGLGE